MSLGKEFLDQAHHMASINPTLLIGAMGGTAVVALNAKKLTPHWHHTINEGEVGVWLRRGRPILEKGYTREGVEAAEEKDPFSTDRHYRIQEEGWKLVRPFYTLQTVDVADQPSLITLGVETADKPRQQLAVHANITWHVSREGDNPVRSITRVKHIKTDKKDQEAHNPERKESGKVHPLEARVQAICMAGLGRVLSGRESTELYKLTYLGEAAEDQAYYQGLRDQVQEATIAQCALDLIYYGVKLKKAEILPVVRTAAEVQAQALLSLGGFNAALGAATNSEFTTDNVTGLPSQRTA